MVTNTERLWPRIWHLSTSDGIPKRSFWATVIVGTILNIINQGDYMMLGDPINLFKIVLTYAVPFCVATYGAVTARLAYERSSK
jgi:hypothetical protein